MYKHYANITDAAELNMAIIKTTQYNVNSGDSDSEESRSLIHQTRTVLATRTKHRQRRTLLFMAPEQLPGKCQIKQAKQEDLMKADIWNYWIYILKDDKICISNFLCNLKLYFYSSFISLKFF